MSLFHRVVCLGLLVASLIALKSGMEFGGARSAAASAIPVARLSGLLPRFRADSGGPTEEEERLRLAVSARESEISSLRERLGALTSFRNLYPDRYEEVVEAEVLTQNDGHPFTVTVTLSRGEEDGVAAGDSVVWHDALVGRVWRTGARTCQARWLTDPKMRVPALVAEASSASTPGVVFRELGVLVGRSERTCLLEMVPWTTRIEPGTILVSSGFGGEIPRGLVLGRVLRVGPADAEMVFEVEVEPAVDLARLTDVWIVRTGPAR